MERKKISLNVDNNSQFEKSCKKYASLIRYNLDQIKEQVIIEIAEDFGFINELIAEKVKPFLGKEDVYEETDAGYTYDDIVSSIDVAPFFTTIFDIEDIADYLNNDPEVTSAMDSLFSDCNISDNVQLSREFIGNSEFDIFYFYIESYTSSK